MFYSENNHSPEQPPRGCGKVPITGGFQDTIGQGARCYTHFKKVRKNDTVNCRSVSLPSVSQKIMEKDLMEAVFKHMKDKNMFGNRQRGFTKAKREDTDWVDYKLDEKLSGTPDLMDRSLTSSDIPQGPVLGLILLNTFINDLDDETFNSASL
ncbi:hypothetical protein QYF61_019694 [Mycteria americana]|uniref:Reverse transcriptase domain-containing protein n=1 Tax=Mycteria americana TaxID=33587 RepID=A0AAN7NVW0_MYCAM|nr:hypothetical protein QYF61_019694 [Mycteria americana]